MNMQPDFNGPDDFEALGALWRSTQIDTKTLKRKMSLSNLALYFCHGADWVATLGMTGLGLWALLFSGNPEYEMLAVVVMPAMWAALGYASWVRWGLFRASGDGTLALLDLLIKRSRRTLFFLRWLPLFFLISVAVGVVAGYLGAMVAEGPNLGDRFGREAVLRLLIGYGIAFAVIIPAKIWYYFRTKRELTSLEEMRAQLD